MSETEKIEEIRRCTETLIHNQAEECRWNDKMLEPTDRDSFEEVVKARSEAIRSFYQENEACIAVLKAYVQNITGHSHEVAMALYEAVRTMHLQGRMDPGLLFELSGPVVTYLRSREDEVESAIILTMLRASASADYYNRMLDSFHADELRDSLEWILSHEDRYCSFERLAARMNIFYAYAALVALRHLQDEEAESKRIMDLIRRANALWQRPEVQELDGSDPEFAEVISNIQFWFPLELIMTAHHVPEIAEEALALCKKECESYANSENWMEICLYEMVRLLDQKSHKLLTSKEYTDAMMAVLKRIPDPMWDTNPEYSQVILQLYVIVYTLFMQAISKMEISEEEKDAIVTVAWEESKRIFKDLPYQYQTAYVNGLCKSLFDKTIPGVSDPHFVEQLADELMIRRQPATYFHSYMVEKIAASVAEEMLDAAPELFLTLPGYDSIEAVKAGREEILAMICRGARLHDLGKCDIASVIMLQSRKLLEDEFTCIKIHPDRGAKYLEKYKEYEACTHMIRGHHKTYDGTKGYPADFDNTTSPYRLLIDLISISDSVDAATDILGRNYASGKDFGQLLEELKEGAGTRYNPDIVDRIAASPALIEKLTALTGKDRIDHCYEIYSRVV